MAVPTTLPIENRTAITEEENITFCSSPVHLRLQNAGEDSTIQKATVYLWIWSGDQTKTLGSPNHILVKEKISASDNYINFEISDLLKSYINPLFVYNELSNPAIVNQGVFWQIVTDIESEADIVRNNYNTCFATLGYRWNYEQSFLGNNGVQQGGSLGFVIGLNRWYNPRIHNYITQAFNLANSVEEATTANMITVTDVPYNESWQKCVKDSCLIVYLDKRGLFEMFTPIGKITVNGKIDSQTNNRTFRDPSTVDNSFQHSKLRDNLDVSQSYTINTGMLQEQMVDLVEEIIYSPKVYLIRFKGDIQEATTIGLTIDNTYVTIDDTTITIDSLTITDEAIGKFRTHQQIPVVVTDSDFQRKTRINDKIMIDYNIKFDETNNKILDIR